jgi:hypothetical protein
MVALREYRGHEQSLQVSGADPDLLSTLVVLKSKQTIFIRVNR